MRSRLFLPAAFACGFLLCLSSPARAQYTNPYTGNTFNNPASSFLDTVIMNNMDAAMLSNSLFASGTMSRAEMASRVAAVKRSGEKRIKAGKASTRFTPRPFPLDFWMKRWSPATPADRKRLLDEYKVQQAIWDAEAARLHANRGDMAETLSVDFALAWQVYSGQQTTERQFRWLVGDFRRSLLQNAYFQGMPQASWQVISEGQFLNATDPVRQWRLAKESGDAAQTEKARLGAKKFLEAWWDEPADHIVATPDAFINRPKK